MLKIIHQRGFSLVEILIALTISAIVAGIAYPSYLSYMMESRRQDGIAMIMQNQQIIENYIFENSGSIPTIAQAQAASFTTLSTKGFYAVTYCVDNAVTPTLYFIAATSLPAASGALGTCISVTATTLTSTIQSNDTGCTNIFLHSKFSGIFPASCR
jgi:type IV pilus assembly protein PilE